MVGLNKEQLLKKRKAGRPKIYDPDKIAEELLEWVSDEESINIAQFCADRGYLPTLIWRLCQENEDFDNAYILAKLRLAERRERLMNHNIINYGAWNRYQYHYDAFLARNEDVKDKKDAELKKGIIESAQMNLVMLAKMAAEGKISQK